MASFVGASALATGSTTALPVYASAVAGNLLIALVTSNQTTPAAYTLTGSTAGWNSLTAALSTNCSSQIWWKIAVGSDTMPTWNGGTTLMECIVAEFSAVNTLDQQGTNGGASTSPAVVTNSATDGGAGRLIVSVIKQRDLNTATTGSFTDSYSGSGTANTLGDNSGTSQNSHHHSSYCLNATTGGSADSNSISWTMASQKAALSIASFYLPSSTAKLIVVQRVAVQGASLF